MWESIETDDGEGHAPHDNGVLAVQIQAQDSPAASPHTDPHRHNVKSTGTQTTPIPPSPPSLSSTTPNPVAGHPAERSPTPTRADLIARALHCPLPHPGFDLPGPVEPPRGPITTASPARRQRGRPRKSGRRRIRFSDPTLPEDQPELGSRDSHVFVRLVRVIVDDQAGSAPRQRHEFVWNNRVKGWKPTGRRSDAGFFELLGLFEAPSAGPQRALRLVVLPVEGGGVRQPVEMAWDVGRFCFIGGNQDGETLSVTLGEMKDAVRDPWARQFVGYVLR